MKMRLFTAWMAAALVAALLLPPLLSGGLEPPEDDRRVAALSAERLAALPASARTLIETVRDNPDCCVPGELLIRPAGDAAETEPRMRAAHALVGANVVRRFRTGNAEHVRLPSWMSLEEAIAAYAEDPAVAYVEPNYRVYAAQLDPEPEFYDQQWNLPAIDVPQAWDLTTGDPAVRLGQVDTEIDTAHPDLQQNVAGTGSQFDDSQPEDHGTHVAGVIAAEGEGVAGVNLQVSLYSHAALEVAGPNRVEGSFADVIAAVEALVDEGVRVINASFGTDESPLRDDGEDDTLKAALRAAGEQGVLVVAAAGNAGEENDTESDEPTGFWPASYRLDNIISVAASDEDDERASFSNFGETDVHLAAPGVDILSAVVDRPDRPDPYEFRSGTSMAVPHVVGIAGLVLAQHGVDTPYQAVRERLLMSARLNASPDWEGLTATGGIVNAYDALTVDLAGLPPFAPSRLRINPLPDTSELELTWLNNSYQLDALALEHCEGDGCDDADADFQATGGVTLESGDQEAVVSPALDEGETITYRVCAERASVRACSGSASYVATSDDNGDNGNDDNGNGNDDNGNGDNGAPDGDNGTGGGGGGGGCFIATAAWGSEWDAPVATLRQFRDEALLTSRAGQELVSLYYHFSPAIADRIAEDEELRARVRQWLAPFAAVAEQAVEAE